LHTQGAAGRVSRERIQQEREEEHERKHRRLRRKTMPQIVSGDWNQALDSIEVLYQDGADRQEVIHLLREFEARLATLLSPGYRQMNQRSAALVRRFDELVERVGGGPLTSRDRPRGTSIG
jgi:exonuclease III